MLNNNITAENDLGYVIYFSKIQFSNVKMSNEAFRLIGIGQKMNVT